MISSGFHLGEYTIAEQHKKRLKAYLLGELSPEEEVEVEVRLLSDPEFATELDITVNELIDRYVSHDVEGDELTRVENYLLKSPERREKLNFAQALKELQLGQPRLVHIPRPYVRYLAIAACLLVVAGLGFLVWRSYFEQRNIDKGLSALQAAYREQRLVASRLSDFSYAPLSNQRGGWAKVDSVQRDLAGTLLLSELARHPTAKTHHAAGQYYLATGQLSSAIEQLNAAVDSDPNDAKIQSDLGAALLELGKQQLTQGEGGKELEGFARSLEHLTRAIQLNNSLLEAYFNRALVLQQMMSSEQAISAWNDYLQKDSTSPWADEARANLKLLTEQRQNKAWNVDNSFRRFLAARENHDDTEAWNVFTASYTSAGNEITNRLIDCVLDPKSSKKDELEALSYISQLERTRNQDQYTSDLVHHYQTATLRDREVMAVARAHLRAGYESFTQSRFTEAIDLYTKAQRLFDEIDDIPESTFAKYRLAHCYTLANDLQKARLFLNQLLRRSEVEGYKWLFAQSLYGLANVNANENEYSKALDYSSKALDRFGEVNDANGIIKTLGQLADLNESLNRMDRALSYLSRSLAIAEQTQIEPMQRWGTLNELAFNMENLQLNHAALTYQREALSVALEMKRPLLISRSLGNAGSCLATLRLFGEAVNFAQQALDAGRKVPDPGGTEIIANASLQLGDIYRQAGNCDSARNAYDESIRLYKELKLDYYSYAAHKGRLQCAISSRDDSIVGDELHTILDLSNMYREKITTESERNTFFDLEHSVFDIAIDYALRSAKDPIKAFEYAEQSRARSMLNAMQRSSIVVHKSYGPDLEQRSVAKAMSLAEIQDKMPAGTQILQYAVLSNRILMWVLTKSAIHHAEVNVSNDQLTRKVLDYLKTVSTRPVENTASNVEGVALSQILIAPAESYLDKKLFLAVVPDKVLNYVPFGALTSTQSGRYLIEDYDIGLEPSATIFANLCEMARRKNRPREETILSVGNPRFDQNQFDSLQDLPAAAEEARAVAGFYRRRRVLSFDRATEPAVREGMAKADVIHLAMHFVVNPRSEMLSGFPLTPLRVQTSNKASDGFLQAYEIYSFHLRKAQLVLLSACQTAIEHDYQGEGAINVARPFLVAGVPLVVASLWPVDSDASADLMIKFHESRTHNLTSAYHALGQAQIAMVRGADQRYRHPYYWAAFIAIGGQSF
jgi:CHAT domain-containing protein/Flp pilus assembly protein TadD